MGKKYLAAALILLAVFVLSGCAAGPNPAVNTFDSHGVQAGFWLGLWHGMIAPITFIISLFEPSVHFYETHNIGAWYNLGFLMGIGAFTKGTSEATSRRRS